MTLKDQIQKYIGNLNDIIGQLNQVSLNINNLVVILEDIYNLLQESIYKGDINEFRQVNFFEDIEESSKNAENHISPNLKQKLETHLEICFDACKYILKRQNSNLLNKSWQWIKIKIFDNDPEDVLYQQNYSLLYLILRLRVELKEKKFAIFYKEISELKASLLCQQNNKRISQELEQMLQEPLQKIQVINFIKNDNDFRGNKIQNQKTDENLLTFGTPLPSDADDKLKYLNQYLQPLNLPCLNIFNQQIKDENLYNYDQIDEKKESPINHFRFRLEPYINSTLKIQDDCIEEVSIQKTIDLNKDMKIDGQFSYKYFYSFSRNQYIEILKFREQDLCRIQRIHASLKVIIDNQTNQVKFYLVNNSPSGTFIQKLGTQEWLQMRERKQETQIFDGDQIGLLFDIQDPTNYLIGYKFNILPLDINK
ncbi:hypothetical protein ABPG72_015961 [Tetrahymena utriculariae]